MSSLQDLKDFIRRCAQNAEYKPLGGMDDFLNDTRIFSEYFAEATSRIYGIPASDLGREGPRAHVYRATRNTWVDPLRDGEPEPVSDDVRKMVPVNHTPTGETGVIVRE